MFPKLGKSQIPSPTFQPFQPISSQTSSQQTNSFPTNNIIHILPEETQKTNEQNLKIMQQMGMQIPGDPLNDTKEKDVTDDAFNWNNKFNNSLSQFLQLDPEHFSIIKAVYLCEAPFYSNASYTLFDTTIKQFANIVRQLLWQEGLGTNSNTLINYGIQKLFVQDNTLHNYNTGKDEVLSKIQYDFDDYDEEKDWRKMFVSKVLQTGSGNCHSLPLLYLCIAEAMHGSAYLSLAPNHSFIQFLDNKKKLHNFETTSGVWVPTEWMMQSDAIGMTALKNGTYLDTLSSRKLYAQCLSDLQMDYIIVNGYDQYSQELSERILAIDSTNLNALLNENNYYFYVFEDIKKQCGDPPKEQLEHFPRLAEAFHKLEKVKEQIAKTGYQNMPPEQYQAWLRSIEEEKKKAAFREEQAKMQQQVQQLKIPAALLQTK